MSRYQLVSSIVRISGCYVRWFCLLFCNIIVGTEIFEGLWLAVNGIHKVSTWERQGISFSYVSLCVGSESFSERLY